MPQKKNKLKKKKDKSIFHKESGAGKGDTPRSSISTQEWSDRWDKVFGIKNIIKRNQNEEENI